ncbi:MAG: MATE family efflux transporter [Pseudomonadota bacterium]
MSGAADAASPEGADRTDGLSYGRVIGIALPVVLSNALVPLQGAIDTAIIGNLGDTVLLAAVALGASAMALIFTSFNFLQIGVSGTTAQALGADNMGRVANTLARALILGLGCALALVLLQAPIILAVLSLFEASAEAENAAARYIAIRIWGGPFELANYALMGWFVGQERTRRLFEMQLVLSVTNVAVTATLVLGLGFGIEGTAIGTVTAHAAALSVGLWRARGRLGEILPGGWRPSRERLLDAGELGALMRLNRDIFIRTALLTLSFAWITRLGSVQGDLMLAANGILMEFFFVTAAGLDGFAIAAETLVGQAVGGRSARRLHRAVLVSSVAAAALACGFALLLGVFSMDIVRLFTNVEAVREAASAYVLWAALIPLAGVACFQLDGIFVGAAAGPAMRNAMIAVACVFLPLGWIMTETLGNHGMWASVWIFLLLRAVLLAARYPALARKVEDADR